MEKEVKLLTLCLYQKDGQVLLGMKKTGFGAGRWNGFGGKVKVDEGETIEQAAIREMDEECGLVVEEMEKIGIVRFEFIDQPDKLREMHVFRVDKAEGEVVETDEMKPEWFEVNQVPYQEMWGADKEWMPVALAGKQFEGRFLYQTPENDEVLERELTEIGGEEVKSEIDQLVLR